MLPQTTTRPATTRPPAVGKSVGVTHKRRIHELADQLGYCEAARRNVQAALVGKRSCADMNVKELKTVRSFLEQCVTEAKRAARAGEVVSCDEALEVLG